MQETSSFSSIPLYYFSLTGKIKTLTRLDVVSFTKVAYSKVVLSHKIENSK